MKFVYRYASTEQDYGSLRRLNHAAFAEQLGQHATRPDGRLADRFESKSRYLLACDGELLAAMIRWSMEPPFSIESRLSDPSVLGTLPQPLCEVRLLAIAPE